MNEFKFYCSHCDHPLKCDPCFAGRQIQCPGCNVLIRIPSPPAGTGFTHVEPQSGHTWDTHPPKGQKGQGVAQSADIMNVQSFGTRHQRILGRH